MIEIACSCRENSPICMETGAVQIGLSELEGTYASAEATEDLSAVLSTSWASCEHEDPSPCSSVQKSPIDFEHNVKDFEIPSGLTAAEHSSSYWKKFSQLAAKSKKYWDEKVTQSWFNDEEEDELVDLEDAKQPSSSSWSTDKQRVRAAFRGKLNNMKYGWNLGPSHFCSSSPVWLLGRMYHVGHGRLETSNSTFYADDEVDCEDYLADNCTVTQKIVRRKGVNRSAEPADYYDFVADFTSRLWFTYRSGFPDISMDSHVRTDCGWGCMLRTGQMLIAQAFSYVLLGREFNIFAPPKKSLEDMERKIISYFGDTIKAPFSIHSSKLLRLVEISSLVQDKNVGDWYGPAAVAQLFRDLFKTNSCKTDEHLSKFAIYVARDCAVTVDDVFRLCNWRNFGEDKSTDGRLLEEKALILLVPLRLGVERTNEAYFAYLTLVLSLENCLGIMGGRPKHSLYFCGWHGRSLIYMDPHWCHEFVNTGNVQLEFPVKSYHCHKPRKMAFREMDPSCAVGFCCKDASQFDALCSNLKNIVDLRSEILQQSNEQHWRARTNFYPLFSIVDRQNHTAGCSDGRQRTAELHIPTRENASVGTNAIGIPPLHETLGFELL